MNTDETHMTEQGVADATPSPVAVDEAPVERLTVPAEPAVVVTEAMAPVVEATPVPAPPQEPATPVQELVPAANVRLVGTAYWRPAAVLNRAKTSAYIYELPSLPGLFVATSMRLPVGADGGVIIEPKTLHGSVLVMRDPSRQQEFITSPTLV